MGLTDSDMIREMYTWMKSMREEHVVLMDHDRAHHNVLFGGARGEEAGLVQRVPVIERRCEAIACRGLWGYLRPVTQSILAFIVISIIGLATWLVLIHKAVEVAAKP